MESATDRGVEAEVSLRELSRRFGGVYAVKDLTFDVARGELFGIMGRDGAGKTTTLRNPRETALSQVTGAPLTAEIKTIRCALSLLSKLACGFPKRHGPSLMRPCAGEG